MCYITYCQRLLADSSDRFFHEVSTAEDDLRLSAWVDLDALHHLSHDGVIIPLFQFAYIRYPLRCKGLLHKVSPEPVQALEILARQFWKTWSLLP